MSFKRVIINKFDRNIELLYQFVFKLGINIITKKPMYYKKYLFKLFKTMINTNFI